MSGGKSNAATAAAAAGEEPASEKKRYTCEVCLKQVSSLSQHKRIHLPREYKCEPCDLLFTLKPHLKRHEESHVHRSVVTAALRNAREKEKKAAKVIPPPPSSPPPGDLVQQEGDEINALTLRVAQQETKVSGLIPQIDTIKQCLAELDAQQRAKWAALENLEAEYGKEAAILAEFQAKLGAQAHVCNVSAATTCVAEYSVEPCGHLGCVLWKNEVLQTKLCPMCGQQVARVVQNIM